MAVSRGRLGTKKAARGPGRGGRVRVKICGLIRPEDAALAASLGADAIGVVFAPESPRRIRSVAAARAVLEAARAIKPGIEAVGVFVNEPAARVARLARALALSAVQLHGEETPEYVRALRRRVRARVWRALRLRNRAALEALDLHDRVDLWVLDAYRPRARGGTGATCDWRLAAEAAEAAPALLSGGLTPENVAEGIRRVRPVGVDVSSGVERAAGVKDPEKLKAFFRAVRGAGGGGKAARVAR